MAKIPKINRRGLKGLPLGDAKFSGSVAKPAPWRAQHERKVAEIKRTGQS
jgi:hypothetical protein